jgi:hypothetical protein
MPKGYYLKLAVDGACTLVVINGKTGAEELGDQEHQETLRLAGNSGEKGEKQMVAGAARNFDVKKWHNLKLQFAGDVIIGFVDGAQVLCATNNLFSHGMAGLVTGDAKNRNTACFDNLLIRRCRHSAADEVFAGAIANLSAVNLQWLRIACKLVAASSERQPSDAIAPF